MSSDITVVIPHIAGRADRLAQAVHSVSLQTVAPEAVIIQYDHSREGAATTRNKAIEKVNTTWTAFLDDDDILFPNHLEVCLNTALETGADLVYPYGSFPDRSDPLAVSLNGAWVSPFGVPFGPEQEWHMRHNGNFIPVTHLCRTELVKKVGGFPQQNAFNAKVSGDCEDYGLLLALLDAGAKFVHAPVVTWAYNFHGSNTGGRPLQ